MNNRILIIDDSKSYCDLATEVLTHNGYSNIDFARSAEEGLQKVADENPDLVIIDAVMPDINGFDVCEKIRKDRAENIKLLIITGDAAMINTSRAREAGADAFTVKVSDQTEFLSTIKKLLDGAAV